MTASSNHVLRQARTDDLAKICEWTLALQKYEQENGRAMLPVRDTFAASVEHWLKSLMASEHALFVIAEVDAKPVGFALGMLQLQPNAFTPFTSHGLIQLLWVEEPWRRLGIAEAMVASLLHVFNEHGAGYVEIQHIVGAAPASKFWQKLGFAEAGVIRRRFIG